MRCARSTGKPWRLATPCSPSSTRSTPRRTFRSFTAQFRWSSPTRSQNEAANGDRSRDVQLICSDQFLRGGSLARRRAGRHAHAGWADELVADHVAALQHVCDMALGHGRRRRADDRHVQVEIKGLTCRLDLRAAKVLCEDVEQLLVELRIAALDFGRLLAAQLERGRAVKVVEDGQQLLDVFNRAQHALLRLLLDGSPAEVLEVGLQPEGLRRASFLLKLGLEVGVLQLQLRDLVLEHLDLLLHEGGRAEQPVSAIRRDVIAIVDDRRRIRGKLLLGRRVARAHPH
mmetsp:Transcript_20488/g.63677  ORF Transcript_20488/g.63677 Transcript_20488/m.63677 type:complete len:287 (-) Transcript_20488:129-989(-)